MASQFTNPFTNPGGFFSTQPGGFFAAPQGGNTLTGLISDPRVNIGLAIAQGQPIGRAILGGALQAQQVKKALQPGEYKSAKAKDGYIRYTEGPDKGKKVFPDIEDNAGMLFDNEDKLRKNFQDQSKDFKKINAAYGRILSNDPTPAGDVSLIFQYMKMLDPASTVREGEFATVQNAGSIPERLWSQFNKAKEGTLLTDTMRADFRKQADNLYATALDNQSYIENEFNSLSEAYGFDPKRIVTEYGKPLEKQIYKNQVSTMTNEELGQLNLSNLTPIQLDILKKELIKRGKTN